MMPVKKLNRLPGVFGDLFYDQWPDVFPRRGATPPINVIETDKKFKVEIAAPGLTKEDFKIELKSENQLVVCLEHCDEKGDKGGECCGEEDCTKGEKHHYLRREFSYTSFRQIFNLPESVDRDKITAKMKHGVLCIKLPKRDGADVKRDMKMIAIE